METILVVDNEKNFRLILEELFKEEGYEVLTAENGQDALDVFKQSDVDLILTDMRMPVMDGIHLLEAVKQIDPQLPVIMMTAHGTVDKAVEAMQKGAYTYVLKPFDNDQLLLFAGKAVASFQVVRENRRLRQDLAHTYSFDNIIGKSKAMQNIFAMIGKVAPSSATVLIEGESGTGKELVAKAVHYNSSRRDKPFVAVNCSALSESLLESELFGHEKGAFTGAISTRKGRFELAHGGTLFLDEIGEISHNIQVKLLRVLEERTFERVGGATPISVDIRIIAATNKNLQNETAENRFREDLYYRLNVIHLQLPPLRERKEDLKLMVQNFIQKQEMTNREIPVQGVDGEVERLFYQYSWPGNVRELEHVMEHALIFASGELITVDDLPNTFRNNIETSIHLDQIPGNASLPDVLEQVEKAMIMRAMEQADSVQTVAAEILGIGKSGLNQKLKKYNLLLRPIDQK